MVIWIIGLSGAGKSAIGQEVYRQWRMLAPCTVLLDGDHLRQVFAHDDIKTDYSIANRRVNGERAVGLCKLLDDQQINVVCCLLSIFEEHRRWNRDNLKNYFEVFVDVPMTDLVDRDNKQLYKPALAGQTKNVVGVDIPFDSPANPDLVIRNNYKINNIKKFAAQILRESGVSND